MQKYYFIKTIFYFLFSFFPSLYFASFPFPHLSPYYFNRSDMRVANHFLYVFCEGPQPTYTSHSGLKYKKAVQK